MKYKTKGLIKVFNYSDDIKVIIVKCKIISNKRNILNFLLLVENY